MIGRFQSIYLSVENILLSALAVLYSAISLLNLKNQNIEFLAPIP